MKLEVFSRIKCTLNFLCCNFNTMNQKKYIMSGVLVLVVGAVIYFGFKKFSRGKNVVNSENIIDNDKPIDTLIQSQIDGKMLFIEKCATCHAIFKDDGDMSRLLGFTEREPWNKRQNVYDFIRNPSSFIKKDEYGKVIKKRYNAMMTAFPDLTNEEIDAICDYLKYAARQRERY